MPVIALFSASLLSAVSLVLSLMLAAGGTPAQAQDFSLTEQETIVQDTRTPAGTDETAAPDESSEFESYNARNYEPPPIDEYFALGRGLLLENQTFDDVPAAGNAQAAGDQKSEEAKRLENINTLSVAEQLEQIQKGQITEAMSALTPLANRGHMVAQETLGLIYYQGLGGTQKDTARATQFFLLAADQKRPIAMHYLSNLYFYGDSVPQDSVQAYMWVALAELYYQDDNSRSRAEADRESIGQQLTRRNRQRGEALAYEWLRQHGDQHLMQRDPTLSE